MLRPGWAESQTYEPDVRYRDRLNAAERLSVRKVTGVRLLCGRSDQPIGAQFSQKQLVHARRMEPDQGQFSNAQRPLKITECRRHRSSFRTRSEPLSAS